MAGRRLRPKSNVHMSPIEMSRGTPKASALKDGTEDAIDENALEHNAPVGGTLSPRLSEAVDDGDRALRTSEDIVTSEGLSRRFDRLSLHNDLLGNAQFSTSEDEEEDETRPEASENGRLSVTRVEDHGSVDSLESGDSVEAAPCTNARGRRWID